MQHKAQNPVLPNRAELPNKIITSLIRVHQSIQNIIVQLYPTCIDWLVYYWYESLNASHRK